MIAKSSEWFTRRIFHYKVRLPFGCRACIEDLCKARMIHDRKRLLFRFKPCQCRRRSECHLHHLQRNFSADRFDLVCEIDDAKSTFAEFGKSLVSSARLTNLWSRCAIKGCPTPRWRIHAKAWGLRGRMHIFLRGGIRGDIHRTIFARIVFRQQRFFVVVWRHPSAV